MRNSAWRRYSIWSCLVIAVTLGCAETERTVVVENYCVETFPETAYGWYTLQRVDYIDTESETRAIYEPRQVRGWLKFRPDQSFSLIIHGGRFDTDIEGYYDVNAGFMFFYTDGAFEDVMRVYKYLHTHSAITLERYDMGQRRRTITYWRLLPTRLAGESRYREGRGAFDRCLSALSLLQCLVVSA